MLIKQLAVGSYEHKLCCGGACVYSQVSIACVCPYILKRQVMLAVTGNELVILSLIFKKSPACDDVVVHLGSSHLLSDLCGGKVAAVSLSCVEGASVCHEALSIFGENSVLIRKLESINESLSKPLDKCERAAEEQHLALYLTALSQSRNGLVNNCLENGSGNVLTPCALI